MICKVIASDSLGQASLRPRDIVLPLEVWSVAMNSQDFDYFTRRERDERLRAERANSLVAQRAHLEMAERYATMLQNLVILRTAA